MSENWREEFDAKMLEQRTRSQTAAKGDFKGGLGGQSRQHKKYHTATHLTYQALRNVLGDHVVQRGSNITQERMRFDFSHPQKMTPEQVKQAEDLVNAAILKDYPVSFAEMSFDEAKAKGAIGLFEDKYQGKVKVYTVGDPDKPAMADASSPTFSREVCGGPHVEHTGMIGKFRIIKEEAVSAGVRRIKAVVG